MTHFEEEIGFVHTEQNTADTKNGESGEQTCFFGGDISFDEPQEYDDTPDKNRKIRSAFSLTHFSLFVYLLTSQGSSTLMLLFASLFFASSGAIDALSTNTDFILGLNAVCQYLLAFPVFLLLTRGMEKKQATVKRKMGFGEFSLTFVIAEGVMLLGALASTLVSVQI